MKKIKEKIIPIIIIMVLVFTYNCTNKNNKTNINHWVWNYGDKYLFEIDIDSMSEDHISGNYCYTADNGNKIDCGNSKFSGKFSQEKDLYLVVFYSSYCDNKGESQIAIYEDSLVWETTVNPCNEIVFPNKCILLK